MEEGTIPPKPLPTQPLPKGDTRGSRVTSSVHLRTNNSRPNSTEDINNHPSNSHPRGSMGGTGLPLHSREVMGLPHPSRLATGPHPHSRGTEHPREEGLVAMDRPVPLEFSRMFGTCSRYGIIHQIHVPSLFTSIIE